MKKKTRTRPSSSMTQEDLTERWQAMGPLPWLRVLENGVTASSKLDKEGRASMLELIRFVRSELVERTAQTEAETAVLRILRVMEADDQRTLLSALCEAGGMKKKAADEFVAALNFTALGTGTVEGGVR